MRRFRRARSLGTRSGQTSAGTAPTLEARELRPLLTVRSPHAPAPHGRSPRPAGLLVCCSQFETVPHIAKVRKRECHACHCVLRDVVSDTLALLRYAQHNGRMNTTLVALDGGRGETRSEAVARRLRGELAEREISHSEAGRRIGVNPSGMSRRMKARHPWDMRELELVEETCGVDLDYVLTGRRNAEGPRPEGPDGGQTVRHQGLEPRTRWYGENSSSRSAVVVPLRRLDEPADEVTAA